MYSSHIIQEEEKFYASYMSLKNYIALLILEPFLRDFWFFTYLQEEETF